MQNQAHERRDYMPFLDTLKCIAILLVIQYHLGLPYSINGPFHYAVYSIYSLSSMGVPIFFLVNGYLVLGRRLDYRKHLHRIIKLYVLTLAWALITLFVYITVNHEPITIHRILASTFFLELGVNNHLWFMFVLVSIYSILPIINGSFVQHDYKTTFWLMAVLCLVSILSSTFSASVNILKILLGHYDVLANGYVKELRPLDIQHANPFSEYGWAVTYFVGGGIIRQHQTTVKRLLTPPIAACLFLVCWAILVLYGAVMSLALPDKMFDDVWNGYALLPVFGMSVCLFMSAQTLASRPFNVAIPPPLSHAVSGALRLIGGNTLGIYFLHVPAIILLKRIIGDSIIGRTATFELLITVVIAVLAALATSLLRRVRILDALVVT